MLDKFFVYNGSSQTLEELNPILTATPVLQFYPGNELNGDLSNWFSPNVKALEALVATSGFKPRFVRTFGHRASLVADRQEFEIPHWY